METTYMISIVYCILFDGIPIHPYILLICTVLLCHIFRFGVKFSLFVVFKNSIIIYLFLLILLIDVIQNLLFYESTMCFAILINAVLFLNYLTNCYLENRHRIEFILKPYVYYSLYNVITSLFIVALVVLGISYQNNVVAFSIMNSNMTKANVIYYFPYYLAVASNYHSQMAFPVISGLSHEPNAIMYVILPSLFFISWHVQNKYYKLLIYILYVAMLVQTTSTTAIIFFSICIFIEAIWGYVVKKEKLIIYLSIILVLVFTFIIHDFLNDAYLLVNYKVNRGDGSGETSAAMLTYLFSGDSLVGTGHFPPSYGLGLNKIGFGAGLIVGIMDLALFVLFVLQSIRLLTSRSVRFHYLGMGCLYYILHSLKVGYMIYWYPYMMFMIFLIEIANMEYKKERVLMKKYGKNIYRNVY